MYPDEVRGAHGLETFWDGAQVLDLEAEPGRQRASLLPPGRTSMGRRHSRQWGSGFFSSPGRAA